MDSKLLVNLQRLCSLLMIISGLLYFSVVLVIFFKDLNVGLFPYLFVFGLSIGVFVVNQWVIEHSTEGLAAIGVPLYLVKYIISVMGIMWGLIAVWLLFDEVVPRITPYI